MIVEGEYFYKGVERLSWGFGSPNQLGAFLAGVMPLFWALASSSTATPGSVSLKARKKIKAPSPRPRAFRPHVGRMAVWVGEAIIWLAIGATASRGAAVAALGAAFVWSLGHYISGRAIWYKSAVWLASRAVMCVIGLAIFSFGGRIAPAFLAHDNSIGNRFILWSGATRLIAAAPWTGWGVGESGNAFMQWVQPLDRPEQYRTMVNGFLHIGVERGLPWLCLVLFLTITGVSWVWACEKFIEKKPVKVLVRASSCVIASWALSNVFSTLFLEWRLWLFPTLAWAMLVASTRWTDAPWRNMVRWTGCAASVAGIICGALWLTGARIESRETIHLRHPTKDAVMLTRGTPTANATWGFLADSSVLGRRYGHEIRRWGDGKNEPTASWSVTVFDGRFWNPSSAENEKISRWILTGKNAEAANALGPSGFVVFLHPRGQPPQNWAGKGAVVFNGIDEEGNREAWMRWATNRHLQIEMVDSVGLDARAEWPAAYMRRFASMP